MPQQGSTRIFALDRLFVPPGELARCRRLVSESYLPGARERGMTLEGSWVAPPLELSDADTHLVLLWSLPDVAAFWSMRGRAGADPGVAAFWAEIDALVTRRERRFLADAELA